MRKSEKYQLAAKNYIVNVLNRDIKDIKNFQLAGVTKNYVRLATYVVDDDICPQVLFIKINKSTFECWCDESYYF